LRIIAAEFIGRYVRRSFGASRSTRTVNKLWTLTGSAAANALASNSTVVRIVPRSALLQAASVVGRRFDPQLLAAAVGETDINSPLDALPAETLD